MFHKIMLLTICAGCINHAACADADDARFKPAVAQARKGVINPYINAEFFLAYAKNAAKFLPQETKKHLMDLKNHSVPSGYVLFKDLPQDFPLSKTPGSNFPPSKNSFVSEFCLAVFASVLGEPFNYIQEEHGNIFRNIRPLQGSEREQASSGSKVQLELHTETAFHPFKPDFLMLYCLRGDRDQRAYTLVSSLNKVISLLDYETVAELRKQQFKTGVDVSFGNKDKTKYADELIPVLYGSHDDPMITYDLDLMEAENESAKAALERLTKAIIQVQEAVLLEAGHMLVFDNRRVIHGRTAFTAYYDGYDRWLQRVYVSEDPAFVKIASTSGRIIKTEF